MLKTEDCYTFFENSYMINTLIFEEKSNSPVM